MTFADYLRGSHHLYYVCDMLIFHSTNNCCGSISNSLTDVDNPTLYDTGSTEERVVLQERIVTMQHRILKIQLLLLIEYCRVNIRVDKEKSTYFFLAHSHHHEELTMVNTIELREKNVSTTDGLFNK